MVVPRVVQHLEQGANRARLGIPCAEDEGLNPRVQTRSRTHQAGFQRDKQLSPAKAVVVRSTSRLTEGHDFRMRSRVPAPNRLIVSSSNDLPIPDHDGVRDGVGPISPSSTPLLRLIVYAFVFSTIFTRKWAGSESGSFMDFALILFSGLIAFNVFSECTMRAPTLIVSNPNYVQKVVFPLEILPVSMLGSAVIHSLVSMGIILAGLLISSGKLHWTLFYLPLVYLPLVAFTLGASWILASLGVFIRDIGNFIGHVTEQSLRACGHPLALVEVELALERRYTALAGASELPAIRAYSLLSLMRHIFISTQHAARRHATEELLSLCEIRAANMICGREYRA